MDTHFKNKDRIEVVIFKASNVLTPKALQEVAIKTEDSEKQNITKVLSLPQMLSLHKKIQSLEVEGKQFEDICSRSILHFSTIYTSFHLIMGKI